MSGPSRFALPHVTQLHAYTPGLQPTEPGWVKLNTNECPYPPSPHVSAALRREIGDDGASLRLYPNPQSGSLRNAVAQLHGVRSENVVIGNGSDDLLNLFIRCFCGPSHGTLTPGLAPESAPAQGSECDAGGKDAAVGFTFPSYSLYPVLVEIQDGRSEVIEFDRSMKLPLERIAASTARAFFLTSPNAPTGVGFGMAEIEAILTRFQGLLVVDEAYALFAKENAVPLLSRYPNLVVVRTLSKAYALAGIRVGYALAHPEIIGVIDRVRDSYNVSRLSQTAALAALADSDYYASMVGRIVASRDASIERFVRSGWFTYPSQANFIFTEPRNSRGEAGPAVAKSAYEYLYAHKVLVRYFGSHALTASFLRITVGTDDEMLVLHQTLNAWLQATSNA